MPLSGTGPIKMSQIKTELGSSSNSLRAYSAAAGKSAPDVMSEFFGYSASPAPAVAPSPAAPSPAAPSPAVTPAPAAPSPAVTPAPAAPSPAVTPAPAAPSPAVTPVYYYDYVRCTGGLAYQSPIFTVQITGDAPNSLTIAGNCFSQFDGIAYTGTANYPVRAYTATGCACE